MTDYELGQAAGKAAGLQEIADAVKFHAPAIRLPDTLAGAGLGAAAGAATYGVKRLLRDPADKKSKPSLVNHLLVGGGLGAAGANLVGDRARRYLSNRMIPWGYGDFDNVQRMMPTSVQDFVDSAILDKPKPLTEAELQVTRAYGTPDFDMQSRVELLRHGMGLPVNSSGEPIFRSAGRSEFRPTEVSGGVAGNYPKLEYNPARWSQQFDEETSRLSALSQRELQTAPQSKAMRVEFPLHSRLARLRRGYTETYPQVNGPVLDRKFTPFADVLAAHGTELNHPQQQATIRDLWDVATTAGERKQLGTYLWDTLRDLVDRKQRMSHEVADYAQHTQPGAAEPWDKLTIPGREVPTQSQHRNILVQRELLDLLMGRHTPVIEQRFDMSGSAPRPRYAD